MKCPSSWQMTPIRPIALPEVPQSPGLMLYDWTLTFSEDVHALDNPHLWDPGRIWKVQEDQGFWGLGEIDDNQAKRHPWDQTQLTNLGLSTRPLGAISGVNEGNGINPAVPIDIETWKINIWIYKTQCRPKGLVYCWCETWNRAGGEIAIHCEKIAGGLRVSIQTAIAAVFIDHHVPWLATGVVCFGIW